jgi:hypothetical protein
VWSSDGLSLSDNWIQDNSGANLGYGGGIRFASSQDAWMANNMVVDNRLNGTRSGPGLSFDGSSAHLIHTTLARNTGANGQGIFAFSNSTLWLTNTILVSHTVGIYSSNPSVTMTATLWGAGAWANGYDANPEVYTGTINFDAEPAFVDPYAGDYRITNDSGALNQGVDAGIVRDIDGQLRVGLPDLGADEFVAATYLPLILREW